jgi:hypothetical protein
MSPEVQLGEVRFDPAYGPRQVSQRVSQCIQPWLEFVLDEQLTVLRIQTGQCVFKLFEVAIDLTS